MMGATGMTGPKMDLFGVFAPAECVVLLHKTWLAQLASGTSSRVIPTSMSDEQSEPF